MMRLPKNYDSTRRTNPLWLCVLASVVAATGVIACAQEVVVPDDMAGFDSMIAESIQTHIDAARRSPGDFSVQQELGLVYLANGAPGLAERAFTACIEIDATSATAFYYRARSRYSQSNIVDAITDLERAASLEPGFAPLQWRLGFWLLEDGQVDSADDRFNRAIKLEPNSLPGSIGKSMVNLSRRENQAAADRLNGLIARGESHPYIHHLLAAAYRGLRRLNEALQAGSLASGLSPTYPDSWDDALKRKETGLKASLERSRQLMSRQNYDQSLALLKKLRDRFPQDPVVLNYHSYVYSQMGQFDRARDVLLEALELDPDHVSTHLTLSLAYERLGQAADAIKHADRAIELNPRFGPALLQRGRLALLQNDVASGASLLKRAIECGIHEPQERIMYGRVLASQGKWRESATVFQQIVQNNPDEVQAWAGFAICLSQLGDSGTAQAALNRARQLNASDPFVQEAGRIVQQASRNRQGGS